MKKALLLILIIIGLLCGCGMGNPASGDATSDDTGAEAIAASLSAKPGFEKRAEKINIIGVDGEITAAKLHDNKLWLVSENILYTANPDGSAVREIFDAIPENMQYLALGKDGDVYFANTSKVHIFTKDGAEKSQFSLETTTDKIQMLLDLVILPDGNPAALIWSESGLEQGCSLRALSGSSFGDELDFALPGKAMFRGMSFFKEAVLLTGGDGLSVYSDAEGASFPVLKWTDIGAAGLQSHIAGITKNDEIVHLNRSDGSLYAITTLPFERTELTLATISENSSLPDNIETAIAAFNSSNYDYKISVIYFPSLDKLNLELIAGNIPDLIVDSGMLPFESFAEKGLFEDLNPYFDNDPEVALVPVVSRAMSSGDKLFRITTGFGVMSLFGVSDFVGEDNGWTFEEMRQYLADAPEGATVFPPNWSNENILLFLLYQNIDEFIDWEAGRALFDSPDFKALLEFANEAEPLSDFREDDESLLAGNHLITLFTVGNEKFFTRFDNLLEGKAVFKGFPSSKKHSGVLFPMEILAMTTACAAKDGAWDFIRTALLTAEHYQDFPSLQSKFDLDIHKSMTEPRPPDLYSMMTGSTAPPIPPITQQQYEKLLHFLDGVSTTISGNDVIETIIEQEIPAYFAGQKSVDEVCKIIQSRAQIYVGEQS